LLNPVSLKKDPTSLAKFFYLNHKKKPDYKLYPIEYVNYKVV